MRPAASGQAAVGGLMRGSAPGRHCVTAFCGLRPLVLQGEVSPCEPLWPASQLFPCLPNPIEHTRPRGRLQASCLSPCGPAFGCSILFQQNCPCPYPLVWNHPNDAIGFAKLRAGTNGPKKQWRLRRHGFIERATRAKTKTKNQKPKTKNQKPKTKRKYPAAGRKKRCRLLRFSRPIRASPQVKKYGSHARMTPGKDRGTGRALRSVGLTGFF